MLTHYIELLSFYRRNIVRTALISGAGALVLSLLLLREMPIYESTVTMNMQPSLEELQFNNAFLGVSQFNPATIIAQTHIENLLSRPIAGRAIDILVSENGGDLPAEPPTLMDHIRMGAFKTLRILNSGYFVELPEREIFINDLISATKIEIVEGSYILQVSVSYTDPVIAAAASNALARAYIEHTQEEFNADATRVDATLQAVQEEGIARLNKMLEERRVVETRLGISSISNERTYRQDNRSAARTALEEAGVDLLERQSQLDAVVDALASEGDAGIARQLRQDLVEVRGAIAGARVRQQQRRENLIEAEAALRDLDRAQEAFVDVDQRILEIRTDLTELQERRIQIDLARNARLSQVRIISDAEPPVYPKFPKVLINTIVGFIVGGILVMVPIFGRDALGNRLRTTEDLRGVFGRRTLPRLTADLLRSARAVVDRNQRPSAELKAYAEQVGQRIASEGAKRWPTDTLYVTTMDSTGKAGDLKLVLQAVVQILERKDASGEVLPVEALVPISKTSDWTALSKRHVVIGLTAGATAQPDAESLAGDGQTDGTSYAVMLA